MTLVERINNYLQNGGLFNPEHMEHNKVRDLLIDCRDALSKPQPYWNAEDCRVGLRCPKCNTILSTSGGHGEWCPNMRCKYGWETEMDGSPLKAPDDGPDGFKE